MPPQGCLISVIDDDESMLEALSDLLRLLGFNVETYRSSEEFIQSGFAHSPSVILTDIHMPGLSGIDLKRWLDERACVLEALTGMKRAGADAILTYFALETAARLRR